MSKSETRLVSELLKTVNLATNATRYFVKICDVMTRISKADYTARRDNAFGVCGLYESSTKTHARKYTNVTYYI